MKIKHVCDVTGLTDRTIRYYIEEQLIAPAYTENYLGRKSFDFSQKEIDVLTSISVLRKFDFTIDEIRQIIADANASTNIISDVKNRTEEAISAGTDKLQALQRLCDEHVYTLEQLAEELSKPTIAIPEYIEKIKWNPGRIIHSFLKPFLIFAIVWLPIVLSMLVVIICISNYHYPVFNDTMIGMTLISFLPSISVLIVTKTKWKWKTIARRILLVLCVLSIPMSIIMSFGIITKSETTDIRNYRRLDVDCLANRNSFYQDLFPARSRYFVNEKQSDGSWKPEFLDAHYYYCYKAPVDYTYDIYAQWPLEKEDFHKEVARVKALYDNYEGKYVVVEKGEYTCLIVYYGDPPFEKATDNYTYYIFAYDEENLIVRYILCDSLENGVDQPYYLSLDW